MAYQIYLDNINNRLDVAFKSFDLFVDVKYLNVKLLLVEFKLFFVFSVLFDEFVDSAVLVVQSVPNVIDFFRRLCFDNYIWLEGGYSISSFSHLSDAIECKRARRTFLRCRSSLCSVCLLKSIKLGRMRLCDKEW